MFWPNRLSTYVLFVTIALQANQGENCYLKGLYIFICFLLSIFSRIVSILIVPYTCERDKISMNKEFKCEQVYYVGALDPYGYSWFESGSGIE